MRVEIEPGLRLFVDTVGGALRPTDEAMIQKPTLLLLHGGPGFDHSSFRPYFDRFADTHQVLYVDQRGQGRSDGHDDPTGWTFDTWADDVVRLCDALDVEAPVVLGNSFGGFVAMHYAARHPEHASKLILSSTQARRHRDVTAARFEALGGPEARDCYLRVFDGDARPEDGMEYFQRCMPLYSRLPNPFPPQRSIMNLAMMDDSTHWFRDFDARDDMRAIRVPTLILAGEDDPMTPIEAAREMLALLPDGVGRLVSLPDCGHGTYRDQPSATERAVREFLA